MVVKNKLDRIIDDARKRNATL